MGPYFFSHYTGYHYSVIALSIAVIALIYWIATYPTDDVDPRKGGSPAAAERDYPLPPLTEKELSDLPEITLEKLAEHSCKSEDKKVWVGMKGLVFDVSGKDVYMEGGGYSVFTGKDASCALAKMKFEEDLMNPSKLRWSTPGALNEKEQKVLDDWVVFYRKRYALIGRIKYAKGAVKGGAFQSVKESKKDQ